MKRHWACLLAFLIIVALLTAGATAESGREIILDFGLDGAPGIEILEGGEKRLASTRRQPASSLPRSGHWAPNLGPK